MNTNPTPLGNYPEFPPAYSEAPPTYEESQKEQQARTYLSHDEHLAGTSAPPTESIAARSVSNATSSAIIRNEEGIPDINSLSISDDNTSGRSEEGIPDINSLSISDEKTSGRSEEPIKLNGETALTDHASTGSEKEPIKSDTIKSTPKRKSTEYVRLHNAAHVNFSSGKVSENPRIPVDALNVLEQAGLIHRNESGNPELRIPECDFGGEM